MTINDYQEIWFAWYPIKTESEEWAWLEYVGRVYDYVEYKHKYYKIER